MLMCLSLCSHLQCQLSILVILLLSHAVDTYSLHQEDEEDTILDLPSTPSACHLIAASLLLVSFFLVSAEHCGLSVSMKFHARQFFCGH